MPDTKGKRVEFDIETWQQLDQLARGRMMTFQELTDEAFRDVLRKYGRPYDVRDAFRKSAARADQRDAAKPGIKSGKQPAAPKSKRPAKRRAR